MKGCASSTSSCSLLARLTTLSQREADTLTAVSSYPQQQRKAGWRVKEPNRPPAGRQASQCQQLHPTTASSPAVHNDTHSIGLAHLQPASQPDGHRPRRRAFLACWLLQACWRQQQQQWPRCFCRILLQHYRRLRSIAIHRAILHTQTDRRASQTTACRYANSKSHGVSLLLESETLLCCCAAVEVQCAIAPIVRQHRLWSFSSQDQGLGWLAPDK